MRLKRLIVPLLDALLAVPTALAGVLLKFVREVGVYNLTLCRRTLLRIGVFPIRDHYYEPLFNPRYLRHPLGTHRELPGIDWNVEEQLQLLSTLPDAAHFDADAVGHVGGARFKILNKTFGPGDAEYLFGLLRTVKPARVVEIGSGVSTMVVRHAIVVNQSEFPSYTCAHTCIEPYEAAWLEKCGAKVVRERVESVDRNIFTELQAGDILFIDSSHMIRPQGDVLCEFLEILPSLSKGVIVHVHDIFSPRDYPRRWVVDEVRFWNEQYLLEAFLTCNKEWKVIGALNYLQHNHYDKLRQKCRFLEKSSEPGSFYIQRV